MSDEKATKLEPKTEYSFKTAKVKPLKKGGYFMELIYDKIHTDENGKVSVTPVTEEPPFHPHKDLFQALKLMVPHMMLETDFMSLDQVNKAYFEKKEILKDTETTESFKVTGIHLKETKGVNYVVLVGRRILKNKKVLNLSPLFNISNFEDGYPYAENLSKLVDNFLDEVGEYTEGKHAPDAQLKMFAEEGKAEAKSDEATEASIAPAKKAKKAS